MTTAYLNDLILDNGLTYLHDNGTDLYICSQLPSTFVGASTTYALGTKATPTIGTPASHSPSGRQVTVSAITDGEVTATGTASHWAIVDTTNSHLLAAAPLSAPQVVTDGNVFTLASFTVAIPAPA